MNTNKIAISIPFELLQSVDRWAEKLNQSRSRFIVAQLEKQLRELEDREATRLYDQAFQEEEALAENRKLTEEMGGLVANGEGKEEW